MQFNASQDGALSQSESEIVKRRWTAQLPLHKFVAVRRTWYRTRRLSPSRMDRDVVHSMDIAAAVGGSCARLRTYSEAQLGELGRMRRDFAAV
jgi:hypothetical protein